MNQHQATKLFINGKWLDPKSGQYSYVVNPSSEAIIAKVAAANEQDAEQAVLAAHEAFNNTWKSVTALERADYLDKIADCIDEDKQSLAELETTNNGKPLAESMWDIEDASGCFRYYARLARELDARQGENVTLNDQDFTSEIYREPVGVCGLIVPWNYPLLMASWKVAPALAAGCTLVLKPSEVTPLSAIELAKICERVGLPAGVFNLLTGLGKVAGQALVSSPKIKKIAFTGSSETGTRVMQSCANDVKNISLELGGKSPIIVFEDADLDASVEWIMFGIFWNKGEVCSATSRLLVHQSIADTLFKKLKARVSQLKLGDGLEKNIHLGPLVSKSQYEKVLGFIEQAKLEGAELMFGGQRPAEFTKGYFVEPTLFLDQQRQTSAWQNEIFGPVLLACTFTSEDEALAIANDSEYGLGAAVLSGDKARCKRVARKFESGIVWVNCSQPTFTEAPWGGMKKSGIGRELGQFGLDSFLEIKQVTEYHGNQWDWFL